MADDDPLDLISADHLAEPAIALSIGVMYCKSVRGTTRDGLADLLHEYAPKIISVHLQDIVLRMNGDIISSLPPSVGRVGGSLEEDEPDAVADCY